MKPLESHLEKWQKSILKPTIYFMSKSTCTSVHIVQLLFDYETIYNVSWKT